MRGRSARRKQVLPRARADDMGIWVIDWMGVGENTWLRGWSRACVKKRRGALVLCYAGYGFANVDATRPTNTATRPTAAAPPMTCGVARRCARVGESDDAGFGAFFRRCCCWAIAAAPPGPSGLGPRPTHDREVKSSTNPICFNLRENVSRARYANPTAHSPPDVERLKSTLNVLLLALGDAGKVEVNYR